MERRGVQIYDDIQRTRKAHLPRLNRDDQQPVQNRQGGTLWHDTRQIQPRKPEEKIRYHIFGNHGILRVAVAWSADILLPRQHPPQQHQQHQRRT